MASQRPRRMFRAQLRSADAFLPIHPVVQRRELRGNGDTRLGKELNRRLSSRLAS